MKRNNRIILFLLIIIGCDSNENTIKVKLASLSKLDGNRFHVTILKNKPQEKLILPDSINSPKFLSLFYSWESNNDEIISVLVDQKDKNDVLYVDSNNDEDLTNDGSPFVFPLSNNKVTFDIIGEEGPKQKTRLVLFRQPEIPDSQISKVLDKEGNLLPKVAELTRMLYEVENFDGIKRTFYFEDRIGVRKGFFKSNENDLLVGLYDYSNNGIFTDDKDLLLIDINSDGKLDYQDNEEIFKLYDIIRIQDNNYKLNNIDRYGQSISFIETKENSTKYFTRYENKKNKTISKYKLDKEFWEKKFIDINGKDFPFQKLKNKYVLLNFWGEWCQPCRKEIPDLVKARKKYNTKLEIVSFLYTSNMKNAKKFIDKNKVDWVQIKLTEDQKDKFKIYGFPTNLLVFPDGETFIRAGPVTEDFFDIYVK